SLTLIDLASLFSESATRDACDTSPLTETAGVMSSSLFQLNSITRSDSSMRRLIPSSVDLYKYARLLRFWEARNVKRGGELMWVDMLLMDVNVSLIIRFDVLSNPVSPIPAEGFRFRNQTELVGLANTNTQLTDIIGEIVAVKSTVSDPPEDKNRVMVTVKLENDVFVTLSMFDAQAVSFHQKLGGMCGDPKVIVATSINPKMVGGRLFLNATSGTHVYYDKETRAWESFFFRDTGLPAAAPLLKSYAKVEPVTIAELNNFITTAPPQVMSYVYAISSFVFEADKRWCYVACSKCSKKLQRTVTSFECARCNNPHAVGSLRYVAIWYNMIVADDTAEETFVCFDGVMTKLRNLRASEAGFNQKNVIKTFGEMLATIWQI
ncbi:unnamed protein product, partial [Brassica oleracea]